MCVSCTQLVVASIVAAPAALSVYKYRAAQHRKKVVEWYLGKYGQTRHNIKE